MKSIKCIFYRVLNKLYHIFHKGIVLLRLLALRKRTVFLFGYPIHSNLGDQAQAWCIEKWLRENYSDCRLITFNWSTSYDLALRLLRKRIREDDLIFFHSGYLMVDHHSELPVYCRVVKMFPDHKIVIMPQTIHFFDEKVEARVAETFNNHPDLILMCRDKVSYARAREVFNGCKLMLYPDVVTSLIGTKVFAGERKGVLFCMRNDMEAFYKPDQISALRERFEGVAETTLSDTSVDVTRRELERHREQVLEKILESFSKYELIVTDRYHGTIFSLIAGTPVIVLSSADHKLSSGVKWFPESFNEHVVFAKDLDEAFVLAQSLLASERKPGLPPYFKEKYYDVLWEKL